MSLESDEFTEENCKEEAHLMVYVHRSQSKQSPVSQPGRGFDPRFESHTSSYFEGHTSADTLQE